MLRSVVFSFISSIESKKIKRSTFDFYLFIFSVAYRIFGFGFMAYTVFFSTIVYKMGYSE